MTITELKHQASSTVASTVIGAIFDRIRIEGERPIWISLADENHAVETARNVDPSLPLAGIPFAVKDNIDVAGMRTTAGCPAFAYTAQHTAPVVQRLLDAGAILIGKTNMDQFATGLVGTRTPYGACSSVFDSRYISGGSSSGSAVAVARGLCSFSLGTDTAGSGRVPAAFNSLVGLKPTRGLLSTNGVVPACRSLDCISVFAATAADANLVWRVAQGFDSKDPYSRALESNGATQSLPRRFRFGVPDDSQLKFFGDKEAAALYRLATGRLVELGGTRITIDFDVFRETAELLYSGPWVAERLAAVGDFVVNHPEDVHPVVGEIIRSGTRYSAADTFKAAYRLEELKRRAADEWSLMDVLLLPTTGTTYTLAEVESDPIRLNSNLGFYTNFVNLLDLAALALPAGFRSNGLPFGISIIGPAFSDPALLALGERFLGERPTHSETTPAKTSGNVLLAVVGAHLAGEPLNYQLTERGAHLVKSCRTAPDYRLFALRGTVPPKPGLLRSDGCVGWGVEVEVWAIPENQFGSFVAEVPSPLAIGNIRLDDGTCVKGFVCEPFAFEGSLEITRFGGWKNYLDLQPL